MPQARQLCRGSNRSVPPKGKSGELPCPVCSKKTKPTEWTRMTVEGKVTRWPVVPSHPANESAERDTKTRQNRTRYPGAGYED